MKRMTRICLLAAFVCCLLPAFAITERLDDSASPRSRVTSSPMMSEQGLPLDQNALAPATTVGLVKFSRIEYKLATAKYIGKLARIYYVIPPFIAGLRQPSGLRVEWRGGKVFANGSAQPGERFLVWTGTVPSSQTSDGLDLIMRINVSDLYSRSGAGLTFESYFEIETIP